MRVRQKLNIVYLTVISTLAVISGFLTQSPIAAIVSSLLAFGLAVSAKGIRLW